MYSLPPTLIHFISLLQTPLPPSPPSSQPPLPLSSEKGEPLSFPSEARLGTQLGEQDV